MPNQTPSAPPLTPRPTESKTPTSFPSVNPSRDPTTMPSSLPSQVPKNQEPSANPSLSIHPSRLPSNHPSQVPSQTPSISTCQWTGCGDPNNANCIGSTLELSNNVRLGGDPEAQEISVRCCSDTELPDFSRSNDACPFADTEIDGDCYKSVPHEEAVRLCGSIEARLCTKDELERRCTSGTGCGHNGFPVWSSTSGVAGYFDAGDNSYKLVTTGTGNADITETFSCREGAITDVGILTFNEDACAASCAYNIPYTEFENFCIGNPVGVFNFDIPGPFATDTLFYIGNVANGFDLQCGEQLTVSFTESSPNGWYRKK